MALLTFTLKVICSAGCGGPLRLALMLALLAGARGGFAENALPEPQVKAAFLVNFPKYVDWPADAFAETNSPIIVATLGETDLGDHLREMIQGRTVNGRPLHFKVIAENDPGRDFHILFIPDLARRRLPAVLEKLKDSPVLTVGETDDFLARGGVINLTRRDQKVRLEVNLPAARQAGLKISSKLLSVADVVKGK
jgi:hypothetical protein